ncbi:hypothetical protein ACEP6V_21150 [Pseudomonas aeruginosa]|uniref:hypothetical protein n=1 Tax=Pseudomonas aeruginosa TaxID=287 RepID=UPI000B5A607E|nr:hypothetical protein [Pseudomonas aeruginosa]ELN4740336.1 hypothetical protein [Escherichia coli]ASJ88765.1 hypothetical protein PSA83_06639 [Pseudomonas aeruginosa]MCO3747577.1 hypothetical protein [Pseudomonas aeruginosa]MCV6454923.1 hypothetical protein [Pseudomonas aeruginosa]HCF0591507.1 hypothetical protein [Pseudomonas aeruginosa]
MTTSRPAVTVTPIEDNDGNLTHCVIKIGDIEMQAPFDEGHTALSNRVDDETGVELTCNEIMTVTNASRQQMEREYARIKPLLEEQPAGTVAVAGDMFFWLDAENEVVWDQWITINKGSLNPGTADCIGEIDTDELYELAEKIRSWLKAPQYQQADVAWLHAE